MRHKLSQTKKLYFLLTKKIKSIFPFFPNKKSTRDRRLLLSSWLMVVMNEFILPEESHAKSIDPSTANKVLNRNKLKNTIVTVKDFGATGDGVVDDAPALQLAVDQTEIFRGTYICLPNYDSNYLINTEITFTQPGIKIFGFKGTTYNRGLGRAGNIVIGKQAKCAFNLGNSRIWDRKDPHVNPADCWTIENLGVLQKEDIAIKEKNGFVFSSKTNGPDRGIVIKECSAFGLNAPIYVSDPGVDVSLATLVVENCCFNGNNYSVLADGMIYGARIVANQMEQNALGGIHGAFNGPVYIADNMLEGQPHPINIKSPKNGNRLGVVIERNYFEANTGDYLIKIAVGSSTGTITIRDNYDYLVRSKDFFVLSGGGAIHVHMGKNIFEPRCITFDLCVTTIKYGSKILDDVNYYRIRRFWSGNRSPLVIISDYNNLIDSTEAYTTILPDGKLRCMSPFGELKCAIGDEQINFEFSLDQGDVVAFNLFCHLSQRDDCIIQILDGRTNQVLMNGYPTPVESNNKWCLLSFAFYGPKKVDKLILKFKNAKHIKIGGINLFNYGKHNNNGSEFKDIYPTLPNFHQAQ